MRTVVFLSAAAILAGLVAWWFTHRRNKEIEEMRKQEIINAALPVIGQLTSAVQGFATAFAAQRAAFQAEVDDLKAQLGGREDVDLSGLQGAIDAAAKAEADLARAAVANTGASDEVHVDDGGTGTAPATEDGGTVVEAAPVEVPGVPTQAPEQDQG